MDTYTTIYGWVGLALLALAVEYYVYLLIRRCKCGSTAAEDKAAIDHAALAQAERDLAEHGGKPLTPVDQTPHGNYLHAHKLDVALGGTSQ